MACSRSDDSISGTVAPVGMTIADRIEIPEGSEQQRITIPISLDRISVNPVRIGYTVNSTPVVNGAAEDFGALEDGEVIFSPGELQKSISFFALGDQFVEGDESLEIQWIDPINADPSQESTVVTLLNDDFGFDPFKAGYVPPTSYPGWLFEREFNFRGQTTSFDRVPWTREDGVPEWRSGQFQQYTNETENSWIQDMLVIGAVKDPIGSNFAYTSARIGPAPASTGFQYGRLDIRAKLPDVAGLRASIYLRGISCPTPVWPNCGELNIAEVLGSSPGQVEGSILFGPDDTDQQSIRGTFKLPAGEAISDEFHVFSIIWREDRIEWLIDNQSYHYVEASFIDPYVYPFNESRHLVFSLAVGGEGAGDPNATTFPQYMLVDYVRVYRLI